MKTEAANTRTKILDTAQAMIQARGYNAVSFRDLAAEVDIKTASIHYYFPTKEELGVALVERYGKTVEEAQKAIDASGVSPVKKLERFTDAIHKGNQKACLMCLAGILAAEASTLPPELIDRVKAMFLSNEKWLEKVLAAGRDAGEFHFSGSAEKNARALYASLQGALLSAAAFKEASRFTATAQSLIDGLQRK